MSDVGRRTSNFRLRTSDVGCWTSDVGRRTSDVAFILPDYMQVESSNCCFPGKLVSFVHPRELVSSNPQYVTHSPSIRKGI